MSRKKLNWKRIKMSCPKSYALLLSRNPHCQDPEHVRELFDFFDTYRLIISIYVIPAELDKRKVI